MNQQLSTTQKKDPLEDHLAKVLIQSDLSELVPITQRSKYTSRLALTLLILWLLFFASPIVARSEPQRLSPFWMLLCLLSATAVEALNYCRWQRQCFWKAFFRRPFRERIRPPFYWSLIIGIGLLALATDRLSSYILSSLYLQWLLLKGIEDSVKHPEKYAVADAFANWLRRLWHQAQNALKVGLRFAAPATIVSFALNLLASEIWEAIGNASWSRLVAAGGGLYLLALLAMAGLSKSRVRTQVREAAQGWNECKLREVEEYLRSIPPLLNVDQVDLGDVQLIEEQLQWKNSVNLAARVGLNLERVLAQRVRWTVLFASLLTLFLATFVIAALAFLTIPREAMMRWAFAESKQEPETALAIDDLEDLWDMEWQRRVLQLGWPDLAREPLLKVAFLESAILVSLLVLGATSGRTIGELEESLQPSVLARWLTLGVAYLALLEKEFQYLYKGSATAWRRGPKATDAISVRNEILMIPPSTRKLDIYRALTEFLYTYRLPDWGRPWPRLVAIFDSYAFAQLWALNFLDFSSSSHERPYDLDIRAPAKRRGIADRCWVWRGAQIEAFSRFDEAKEYSGVLYADPWRNLVNAIKKAHDGH